MISQNLLHKINRRKRQRNSKQKIKKIKEKRSTLRNLENEKLGNSLNYKKMTKVVSFKVGMTCSGCQGAVTRILGRVSGGFFSFSFLNDVVVM
jgi:Ni,Fe-hydrogenase I small subunit